MRKNRRSLHSGATLSRSTSPALFEELCVSELPPHHTKLGFWKSRKQHVMDLSEHFPGEPSEELPFPVENEPNYGNDFFERIEWLMKNKRMNEMFNHQFIQFRGFSRCRICEKNNGSAEFCYEGFRFPSGYFHYIIDHRIQVPVEFQRMIMDLDIEFDGIHLIGARAVTKCAVTK